MEWRKEIETEFGTAVFDTGFSGCVVSSGSIIVDFLTLVGGFPLGAIVEVFGDEGSGKTTLALMCLREAIKQGRKVLWLDFERTLNYDLLRKLGIPVDSIRDYIIAPDSMEDGFMIMLRFCENPANRGGVIFVDSVAAMPPVADMEKMKEIIGQVRVASMAAVMSTSFRQMCQIFKKADVCAVFLNQERSNIDTTGRSVGTKTTPGGAALKFYSSMRVQLAARQATRVKVEDVISGGVSDQVVAIEVNVVIVKNKLAPSYRRSKMYLRMDEGIDNLTSALNIAELMGLISKKGAFYTINAKYGGELAGEVKAHGFERLRKYFVENPTEQGMLIDDVKTYLFKRMNQVQEVTNESSE